MLAEHHFAVVAVHLPLNVVGHPQPIAEPQRQRHQVRLQPFRRAGDVGFEQAFELDERFLVEADEGEIAGVDARLAQAVGDGVGRKGGVVLLAREALFLRGRDDPAVLDEAGRRIVVVRRDA